MKKFLEESETLTAIVNNTGRPGLHNLYVDIFLRKIRLKTA